MPAAAEPQFLSIASVAAILGVSRWTVSRMLDDGELPHVTARDSPRIDRADLDRWIAAQKANSLAAATARKEARKKIQKQVRELAGELSAPVRRRGRPRKAGLKMRPSK